MERHGFYDLGVVGGGDVQLVAAIAGCFQLSIDYHCMTPTMRDHFLKWAVPFHNDVAGRFGHLPVRISHLWHGHRDNRGYPTRYKGLAQFEFNPYEDIDVDSRGLWRWTSDKPGMHKYVANYFYSRREDG